MLKAHRHKHLEIWAIIMDLRDIDLFEDTNRVNFSSLDEIIALNKYDMRLKTVLYPKVMFIENALKSYVIEALLADSKSENFDVIYNKSLTAYRNYTPGAVHIKQSTRRE